ncbi:MAG: response regulator, partial [Pseudomonadota bacterium]
PQGSSAVAPGLIEEPAPFPGAGLRQTRALMGTLSHELRTPLNGLSGSAQLLLEGRLTPLQRRLCEVIVESGDAMVAVIEDLVALTGMEGREHWLPAAPVDAVEVVAEAVRLVRPMAEGLGARITLVPGPPCPLGADRLRLRGLLISVLGKTVSLAEGGEVRISLHQSESALHHGDVSLPNGHTTIEIAFSGPALTPRLQQRLSARLDPGVIHPVERIDGKCIGFALAAAAAQGMGGALVCLPETGDNAPAVARLALCLPPDAPGSAGHIRDAGATLPGRKLHGRAHTAGRPRDLAPAAATVAATANVTSFTAGTPEPSKSREAEAHVLVLLVDDNATNRLVATHLLRRHQCRVLEAVSGVEALETFRNDAPCLVLMDLSMPVMDGTETARRMRAIEAEEGRAPARIVALTANALEEHERRCAEAGMDGFIAKPIRRETIAELIDHCRSVTVQDR